MLAFVLIQLQCSPIEQLHGMSRKHPFTSLLYLDITKKDPNLDTVKGSGAGPTRWFGQVSDPHQSSVQSQPNSD